MKPKFSKTKRGNYFGYYKGYYLSASRRPHGGWFCAIGKKGFWIRSEGYFSTSLESIKDFRRWAKITIDKESKEWILQNGHVKFQT